MKYIVTHPGSAHKDDFLACCLLVHRYGVSVFRRDPARADLEDRRVAVVDCGRKDEPERANFDHHQFPRDHEPVCALSLVLKHLGLYEDAQQFCDWLEPAEWFDTRGPVATAEWLGVERRIMTQLNSPIDVTMLRRFASETELRPGDPVWEVMRMIGEDMMIFITGMRKRLDYIGEHGEFWDIKRNGSSFQVLFMPRADPLPREASGGLERYIALRGEEDSTVGLIYPDRRGEGYALSRYEDNRRLDFSLIAREPDVHFAHARGFVAKTSTVNEPRLKELMEMAWVGEE